MRNFISILPVLLPLVSLVSASYLQGSKLEAVDGLRYAVLGGANVWSVGNHIPDKTAAFPYLISPTIDNYGGITTGPNYDAVCLESILEDEIYDVIVLDFCHVVQENVLELARRLRQRFPYALIIFVKYWRPLHVRRVSPSNGYSSMDLLAWMDESQISDWTTAEFRDAILADDGLWQDQRDIDGMARKLYEYADKVDGVVVDLKNITGNMKESLANYGHFFAKRTLLSAEGHKALASQITDAVAAASIDPRVVGNNLGGFGGGDSCHVWLTSGSLGNLEYSSAHINQYDLQYGKYALEFEGSGYIVVNNPFEETRRLYVSFIVSHVPNQYPNVRIAGEGIDASIVSVGSEERGGIDYAKTVSIGYLTPGEHRLHILPQVGTASHPFRLVGLTFSNEVVTPDVYGFAPVFCH